MAKPERGETRVASVFEDPSSQAVARMYADAFLQAAAKSGVDAALEEYASFLDNVLTAHPDFQRLLYSGLLGRDKKVEIIDRVIAPKGSELFTNFLRVLARHDRLELLPQILSESRRKHEVNSGRGHVKVASAAPLSPQRQEQIRQQLKAMLPFDPIVENVTDPSLIGGVVIRVGDKVYDSSIKLRLKQLRTKLLQRSVNEIQSGRNRFSHPTGD